MSNDLLVQSITAIYAVCNAVRLLFYVPQIVAVAREHSGAHAISITTWMFWSFSQRSPPFTATRSCTVLF